MHGGDSTVTWYHNQCLRFELFISSHPTRGGHSSTLSKTAKTGRLKSLTELLKVHSS